ncbi:MAG: phosphate signaling complex protein PhoU [Bacilli bacterium]|nr:phosphate signaling complex protein PhoU [Bacilli bacterium]
MNMQLDKDLELLNKMLFQMSDLVVKNISEAFSFYKGELKEEELDINDDIIDQYEKLIEGLCLSIILRERPYAKDLRQVTGILKLVADLERIGDHAEDIMEFSIKLKDLKNGKIEKMEKFVNVTLSMVKESILSYINKDMSLAKDVIKRDEVVDKIYLEMIEHFVEEGTKEKIGVLFAIYNTLVVKYIERIADHAVNIAEWVIYISSGFHKEEKIF